MSSIIPQAGSKLNSGQVGYNSANSTVNKVEQQCSNMTQKATNDVNNGLSQAFVSTHTAVFQSAQLLNDLL